MKTLATNKAWLREFFAEFLGTLFLVAAGDAAVAQMFVRSKLANPPTSNDFLSVGFAYGLAAAFAVYICGGVSGGHINPAVTLTMCLFGKLKWFKLPVYWFAQYLGAFVGAAIVYFVYFDSISQLSDVTDGLYVPGIFATYPAQHMSLLPALLDQIVGTAILLLCVFAIVDPRNASVPKHFAPLLVGFVIALIGMSYGIQCGYAINPARDFAPRLFTLIMNGFEVFQKGSDYFSYYFWIPIVGPHVGAIIGAFVYQVFVGAHWPIISDRPPTVKTEIHVHEAEEKPIVDVVTTA